jgi:hypothetical protein
MLPFKKMDPSALTREEVQKSCVVSDLD